MELASRARMLAKRRAERGLDLKTLSKKLHLKPSTIVQYERVGVRTEHKARIFANLYDLPMETFLPHRPRGKNSTSPKVNNRRGA